MRRKWTKIKAFALLSPKFKHNLFSLYFQQHARPFPTPKAQQAWVVLNELEARIKDKIERIGTPLIDWKVQINYGIKTGYNEAFIINEATKDKLLKESPEAVEIIRPILRGEDIKRFYSGNVRWLINSHNGSNKNGVKPINTEADYPAVYNHLKINEAKLAKRQDKGHHWTNLRNCAYQSEFAKPKIVWGNLNVEPNFTIDYEGNFIASPSVMLVSYDENTEYFLSVLNSSVCRFYIVQLSYERDGGYIEYQKQFVEQLPIPHASSSIREKLKTHIQEIITLRRAGVTTLRLEEEVENLVFDLYGFTDEQKYWVTKWYGAIR